MKYLLISLINAVYGIMLLLTLDRGTPGLFLVLSIASILTIIGVIGFGLWMWSIIAVDKEKDTQTTLQGWYKIARNIDILLIIGLLFRAFILQPFMVDGNSMQPNFQDKEYLLVDQITYRFRKPARGEVIIFHFPLQREFDYIKRIIALPGENVSIINNKILINGRQLEEPYISSNEMTLIDNNGTDKFNKTLGPNEYFVLGDNRTHSSDSREWGTVPRSDIVGRAWLVVTPISKAGIVKTPAGNLTPISSIPVASPTQSPI